MPNLIKMSPYRQIDVKKKKGYIRKKGDTNIFSHDITFSILHLC